MLPENVIYHIMGKEIVRLRQKPLKDGSVSLYLDIYINGQRNYEFLKLYLVPERTRQDKSKNRETMRLADVIKAQRTIEVERGTYGLQGGCSITIGDWMAKCVRELRNEGKDSQNLSSGLRLITSFFGIRLHNVSATTLKQIKDTIYSTNLRHNTKTLYFSRVKTQLRKAEKEGYIKQGVLSAVSVDRQEDTNREHLTMEELALLFNTPFEDDGLRRAFLFSCLTGLRKCDIRALRWFNISESDGNTRIIFRQIKTGGQEYLDINDQAAWLMGERKGNDEAIFDIPNNNHLMERLTRWVRSAGIDKRITFHCARHTFAVMMLELNTNIAVIQKLLGHAKLDTTLIYAKVVDKSKREAVGRIPNIFIKKD